MFNDNKSSNPALSDSGAFLRGFSWMMFFSVTANVLLLIIPLYMTQVYDRVLPSHSVETLGYLTLIACIGLLVFGCIESIRQILSQRLSATYELLTMPKLIMAGSEIEGSQALSATTGSIGKVGVVKRFLSSGAFTGLFDLPFSPLFLGLMFLAHPLIGWLTIGGIVVLVLITLANQHVAKRLSSTLSPLQGQAGRHASDVLRQGEEIRAMGMGSSMVTRWRLAALAAAIPTDELAVANAAFFGLSRFVRQSIQVLVLGAGAWLVISGKMSPSLIFAASLVSSRALMPVEQVVGSWRQISEAREAYRDIAAILSHPRGAVERSLIRLPEPKGRIEARRVGFAFRKEGGAPLLFRDIDLILNPGEIVAIVGSSGSGKSTFARLIAATATPTVGEVLLDGFPMRQWPAEQRGQAFGYMGQENILHEGTIAQNIARFNDASDNSILAASIAAEAHAFIATLPGGYNTKVGPGGIRLSGGQVQRIALARALYGRPKVLVLDEPNSHLDAVGEAALLDVLQAQRKRGCTILAVTHRTGILSIADRILKMDNGRLVPIAPKGSSGEVRIVRSASATGERQESTV